MFSLRHGALKPTTHSSSLVRSFNRSNYCYLVKKKKQIPDASEQLIDSRITKIPARSSSGPTLLSSVCRQESYFVTTGGIAAFCVLFGAAFQTQHFPPVSQVYTGLHIISSDPGAQIGDMWRLWVRVCPERLLALPHVSCMCREPAQAELGAGALHHRVSHYEVRIAPKSAP